MPKRQKHKLSCEARSKGLCRGWRVPRGIQRPEDFRHRRCGYRPAAVSLLRDRLPDRWRRLPPGRHRPGRRPPARSWRAAPGHRAHIGDFDRADLRALHAEQGPLLLRRSLRLGQQLKQAGDVAGQIRCGGPPYALQDNLGQGGREKAGFGAGFTGSLATLAHQMPTWSTVASERSSW